jgi:predicted glutamine amidotransferase
MCRLLAFASRKPAGFYELLGDSFRNFVELSHRHGDGWGFAWYDDSDGIRLLKSQEKAISSETFWQQAETLRSCTVITHLRWAFGEGMTVCQENAHPFLKNDVAFAHNGTFDGSHHLRKHIAPHLQELEGNTDSEYMFRTILTNKEQSDNMEEAIQKTLLEIKQGYPFTGLNFVMLTSKYLYAVCAYHPETPLLKVEHDIYDLHYRIDDDCVIVASSQWPEVASWPMLENGQILRIERSSLQIQIFPINGWKF